MAEPEQKVEYQWQPGQRTGLSLHHVPVPRSRVYISAPTSQGRERPEQPRQSADALPDHELRVIETPTGAATDGRRCFVCHRRLPASPFFCPADAQAERYDAVPYCSAGCMQRAAMDQCRAELTCWIFSLYGPIAPAPERTMLYTAPQEFAQGWQRAAETNRHIAPPELPPFVPTPWSMLYLQGNKYQLPPATVTAVSEACMTHSNMIGESKSRDALQQQVITLRTRSLRQSEIGRTFPAHPASFDRPGIASNIHMRPPEAEVESEPEAEDEEPPAPAAGQETGEREREGEEEEREEKATATESWPPAVPPCFTCQAVIKGEPIRFPEEFHPQTGQPTWNPLPHCSVACALRTVQDSGNGDLTVAAYRQFGHAPPAPPRRLLYHLGTGCSRALFRALATSRVLVREECSYLRPCVAPVTIGTGLVGARDRTVVSLPREIAVLGQCSA